MAGVDEAKPSDSIGVGSDDLEVELRDPMQEPRPNEVSPTPSEKLESNQRNHGRIPPTPCRQLLAVRSHLLEPGQGAVSRQAQNQTPDEHVGKESDE
jgi:hypothetical protein